VAKASKASESPIPSSHLLFLVFVLFIPIVLALSKLRQPGAEDRSKTIQEQIRDVIYHLDPVL